jgi:hypothetical protein
MRTVTTTDVDEMIDPVLESPSNKRHHFETES